MVDSVRFEQLNHSVAFVLLVQQFELLKLERGRRRRRRRGTEESLAYVVVAYVVVVVMRDFVRAHRAVALGKILRHRHSRRRRNSRRKKRTRISREFCEPTPSRRKRHVARRSVRMTLVFKRMRRKSIHTHTSRARVWRINNSFQFLSVLGKGQKAPSAAPSATFFSQ